MERAKQELTGHDFDQLFDDVSSDNATFVAHMLSENYNSFKNFIQHHEEHDKARLLIDNKMQTMVTDCVGAAAFLHGGCPPPRLASSAAVDDTIIKLLGDTGGIDENFWNNMQRISLESTFQRTSTALNRNVADDRCTQDETCSSQNDITMEVDGFVEPETPSSSSNSGISEDALELIKKYSSSLLESLAGGDKLTACRPILSTQEETTRLIGKISNITNSNPDPTTATNPNTDIDTNTKSHSTNNPNTAAITLDPLTLLGKRGRYFLDIWDEEDYLSRIKSTTRLRPLYHWSDLFHSTYSDNHDGCYRDWLVNCQEATKTRLNDPKFKKSKKRSSDPIFRHDTVEKVDNSGLAAIIPPPVPVAIQHPASWAIRPRQTSHKGAKNVPIDVHTTHPASATHRMVHPVHQKDGQSIRAIQGHAQLQPKQTQKMTTETEDVDDFNIYTDRLVHSLKAIEATNFVRLSRLAQALHKHTTLSTLQAKRRRLEDLVLRAAGAMEPTSADRVVYAFKPHPPPPAVQQAMREHKWKAEARSAKPPDVLRLDVWGNEIHPRQLQEEVAVNQQSRYNTRCADNTLSSAATSSATASSASAAAQSKIDALKYRRELVGACSARQLTQGPALLHTLLLQPEAEIEVCLNKVWQVATVCRVLCDGDHIRHVKVTPQDCTAMESVWLAVEDGKLAPYGTHLRPINTNKIFHTKDTAVGNNNNATLSTKGIVNGAAVTDIAKSSSTATSGTVAVVSSVPALTTNSNPVAPLPLPHPTATAVRSLPSLHPDVASAVDAAISLASLASSNTNDSSSHSKTSAANSSINTNSATNVVQRSPPQPSGLMVSDPRLRKVSPSIQNYHTPTLSNGAINGNFTHNGMIALPTRSNVSVNSSYAYAGSILMHPNYANTNLTAMSNNGYHSNQQNYTNGVKVKLGLPLGATDKKELIAAVNAYTPLPMPFATPYSTDSVHSSVHGIHAAQTHAEHAPQPFNPYTRVRFGQNSTGGIAPHGSGNGSSNGHSGPVPYSYEYEGAGEVNHRPVFDSVGYHHLPMNGSIGLSAAVSRPYHEGSSSNGTSNNAIGAPAATATTFRLGKKGQITRN